MNAQETFREMLKSQIAPALRARGFVGSGRRYELPDAERWAVLGFQTWVRESPTLDFTLNILVVERDVWEDARSRVSRLPDRPNANVFWYPDPPVWQQRIGSLVPDHPGSGDIWWRVEPDGATRSVADAVVWSIDDFVLPALRGQLRGAA
jgi:hypothetical protein